MKKLLSLIFVIGIFVSACSTNETRAAPSAESSTPTLTPTATQTPLPPTTTITPLPTIPTFTPTFDVSTIVTVTPAEKAECPQISQISPKEISLASYSSGQKYIDSPEPILNYLNQGGKLSELQKLFETIKVQYKIEDVTNDGIQDLVVVYGEGGIHQFVNLFWCKSGQYLFFPKDLAEAEILISDVVDNFSIKDLNKDGIPEVLLIGHGRTGLNVNLLEWNGETFVDLTSSGTQPNASIPGADADGFQLISLNENSIPEMVLKGTPNDWYYPGEPLREEIDTYQWNGMIFSRSASFSTPEYRFQAVQDGDRSAIQGNYKQALKWYQEVINSKNLDWWSKERFEHNKSVAIGTDVPSPPLDTAEYPHLAAYAYYRIMLIQLAQRQEAEAATTYQTLQDTFSNNAYGSPYVEMAKIFWTVYQSTHKMYDGCAAAIQFAVEHPEILVPLGSDYHGSQSKIYKPEDVCPFR